MAVKSFITLAPDLLQGSLQDSDRLVDVIVNCKQGRDKLGRFGMATHFFQQQNKPF